MIISHAHKFIFFAIPKTGTHAVRFALRGHMGADDEEQVRLFANKKIAHPAIAAIPHGHISWRQIKPTLSPDQWEDYFKFAIVRNPWDRFISFCAFVHRNNPQFAVDPKPMIDHCVRDTQLHKRIIFRPQSEFICDDSGAIQIDYVGRYEDLQTSYDAIADRIGVSRQVLERVNSSKHRPYKDYYDDELAAWVGQTYANDIAAFDYTL